MRLKDFPIRKKVMAVILLTSGTVVILICASFFTYEFITFRKSSVRELSTLGQIIATNSTAALAFDSREDAFEILSALRADPHVVAACVFDNNGEIFSYYPADLDKKVLPSGIGDDGFRLMLGYLEGYQPVIQGNTRLGTLYLRSDMGAIYNRVNLYLIITLVVTVVAILLAYMISTRLQKHISDPILALAQTADRISRKKDYSVRAAKENDDEIGSLTEAFNAMLEQIEEQNRTLSENDARVRAVLNTALSAVVVMDQKGNIIDWNTRAEGIFGWGHDEAVGKPLADLIIPDRYRSAHIRGLSKFVSTGKSEIMGKLLTLSALRRNGTEFPVELSIGPLRVGRERLLCGFVTDITDRKLAEEIVETNRKKLENIVQSMGDGYMSLDAQWRYTFINDKACEMFSLSSENVIGKTLWEVFPTIRETVFEKEYSRIMRERTVSSFEAHYPDQDRWLEVRTYPHEDGIAIFYTDISKYKRAESEIRSFNQKLEKMVEDRTQELEIANKELESFSYSVSHDLRAPLRSIHGYMNIFAEDYANKLDDEARRFMHIIQDNAKRMGRLIDDLLEFSRLGRKELVKFRISMTEMVNSICDELIKAEADRNIDLKIQKLPHGYADSVTIRHVWSNLISNAIKYTRLKALSAIEIGSTTMDGETVYYIKDNGSGFDMRYYDKLFGVFQRLHSAEEFEGTGVGLAIVHRIVTKHGGKIWAASKPGEGASFFFTLGSEDGQG